MQNKKSHLIVNTLFNSFSQKSIKIIQFLYNLNPFIFRTSSLSIIYFLGFLDLFFFASNCLSSCDFTFYIFNSQIKFLSNFFKNSLLRLWGTPERSFITSYIVLELMINRAKMYKTQMPKFYRYHILVVFALIMIQSTLFSVLDLFLHRELPSIISNLSYKLGALSQANVKVLIICYSSSLIVFSSLYIYAFFQGLNGKLPRFFGGNWFNDSLALWLRIKTPTLKI